MYLCMYICNKHCRVCQLHTSVAATIIVYNWLLLNLCTRTFTFTHTYTYIPLNQLLICSLTQITTSPLLAVAESSIPNDWSKYLAHSLVSIQAIEQIESIQRLNGTLWMLKKCVFSFRDFVIKNNILMFNNKYTRSKFVEGKFELPISIRQ